MMSGQKEWAVMGGLGLLGLVALARWMGSVDGTGVVADVRGVQRIGDEESAVLAQLDAVAPKRVVDGMPAAVEEVVLDDDELIAALRALGSFEQEHNGDEPASAARLNELALDVITTMSRLGRALTLLTNGRLTEDPEESSEAERGAVRGLVLGVLVHRAAPGPESGVRVEDPEPLIERALESAPTWTRPVRDLLLLSANRFRSEQGRFLDGRHVRAVVTLRALHPDLSEFYGTLLAQILDDLPEVDQTLLLNILQGEQEDPMLVRLALSQLFGQGRDALALSLARSLLDGNQRNFRLRMAVLHAVAGSAPMEKALDFLLEFGKGSDGGVGVALVQRPGGTEAAMNRYSELVIAGGAPDMRRLLISGMSDPVVLLGVAATDPVADVRGQALLAVSASGDPEVWHKCLGLLEQSIGAPQESAQSSAPYQAAYSAVNLAKRSLGRDAAVLDRAADLLRNLLDGGALDQRTGDFVRAELEGLGLGH